MSAFYLWLGNDLIDWLKISLKLVVARQNVTKLILIKASTWRYRCVIIWTIWLESTEHQTLYSDWRLRLESHYKEKL